MLEVFDAFSSFSARAEACGGMRVAVAVAKSWSRSSSVLFLCSGGGGTEHCIDG
jgi:hypothetical protein